MLALSLSPAIVVFAQACLTQCQVVSYIRGVILGVLRSVHTHILNLPASQLPSTHVYVMRFCKCGKVVEGLAVQKLLHTVEDWPSCG